MKAGSAFASFLSKGATLTLPRGASLARSRAAVAAAALGIAFAASAAHAQTATVPPGTAAAPRIVAQASVPPYAQPGAKPQTAAAPPPAARPAVPNQAAAAPPPPPPPHANPSSTGPFQGRPQIQAAPQAPAAPAGRGNWTQGQPHAPQGAQAYDQGRRDEGRRDHDRDRDHGFGLGAVLGAVLAPQAVAVPTVYGAPAYGAPGYADPGYADPGYADPGYAVPPAPPVPDYAVRDAYGAGTGGPGYRAEDARDPGFPRNYHAPGADKLPETLQIGGEQLDTQTVFATIAAARIVGVTPAALLALQSRSFEAVEAIAAQADGDNPNMPISGPYAYSVDRWQSAVSRFGAAIGLGGNLEQITGGPSGNADVDRSALNSVRTDPYVSSLMAAAEMAANDMAYRQAFGSGPLMAELVVGHHAGREAMMKLSQIYRQAPGTPLAAVVKPNYLRDLVMLTGLSHVDLHGGQWTVGSFIGTLDNALKNGLTRYASVDRMALPPDYKPMEHAMARVEDPTPRAPRP